MLRRANRSTEAPRLRAPRRPHRTPMPRRRPPPHASRQPGEIDLVRGMGVAVRRQSVGQCRRNIGAAIAGDAIGEDHLARGLDLGCAAGFEMQPEMPVGRLDACQAGGVADRDAEKSAIPAEIIGPILARNALDRGIGGLAMPRLVPGLEAQRGDAVFGPRQGLGRAQHIHPGRIAPYPGPCFVRGHVDDRDFADPGPAQRKGKSAAALPAADDHDVVVDPGPVGTQFCGSGPISRNAVRAAASGSAGGSAGGIGTVSAGLGPSTGGPALLCHNDRQSIIAGSAWRSPDGPVGRT